MTEDMINQAVAYDETLRLQCVQVALAKFNGDPADGLDFARDIYQFVTGIDTDEANVAEEFVDIADFACDHPTECIFPECACDPNAPVNSYDADIADEDADKSIDDLLHEADYALHGFGEIFEDAQADDLSHDTWCIVWDELIKRYYDELAATQAAVDADEAYATAYSNYQRAKAYAEAAIDVADEAVDEMEAAEEEFERRARDVVEGLDTVDTE